jgi:hypothetical protein
MQPSVGRDRPHSRSLPVKNSASGNHARHRRAGRRADAGTRCNRRPERIGARGQVRGASAQGSGVGSAKNRRALCDVLKRSVLRRVAHGDLNLLPSVGPWDRQVNRSPRGEGQRAEVRPTVRRGEQPAIDAKIHWPPSFSRRPSARHQVRAMVMLSTFHGGSVSARHLPSSPSDRGLHARYAARRTGRGSH